MDAKCRECGSEIVWDDAVGSTVCTSCGTLTDFSQSVLTSQYEFSEDYNIHNRQTDLSLFNIPARFGSSWALSDSSKDARDKRNTITTSEFINVLSRSFNALGLSARALTLFNQARASLKFRWGRQTKLASGACLAIALRESSRPDCLRDIADLLEEPFPVLARTYTSITHSLGLVLNCVESSAYIMTLDQHLSSLIEDRSLMLPGSIIQQLNSTSLPHVNSTATSLTRVLARIGSHCVAANSAPSIACAAYIISLESELRFTIKQLTPFAEALGARLHVGKTAVKNSYKAVQGALTSLAAEIPWLDKYENKNGRAKVAKRNVAVRATKDILAFYDETWKTTQKPAFNVISDEEVHSGTNAIVCEPPPRKRRKINHRGRSAMEFLLDPLKGPTPNPLASSHCPVPSDISSRCGDKAESVTKYPLLYYFLSNHGDALQPTRLQLLAASRGGADKITDDELFEDGELEKMLRNEEEMMAISHLVDWGGEDTDRYSVNSERQRARTAKHRRKADEEESPGVEPQRRPGRINLEALSRLLNDDEQSSDCEQGCLVGLLGAELEDSEDEFDNDNDNKCDDRPRTPHNNNTASTGGPQGEVIVVEEWRPLSPGDSFLNNSYYNEAYT